MNQVSVDLKNNMKRCAVDIDLPQRRHRPHNVLLRHSERQNKSRIFSMYKFQASKDYFRK